MLEGRLRNTADVPSTGREVQPIVQPIERIRADLDGRTGADAIMLLTCGDALRRTSPGVLWPLLKLWTACPDRPSGGVPLGAMTVASEA